MTQQEFDRWMARNEDLVKSWETYALIQISKGKEHLRSAAITERIRDLTPFTGEKYKIPNECNTWLPRWLIWKYPKHENRFTFTKTFRYETPNK